MSKKVLPLIIIALIILKDACGEENANRKTLNHYRKQSIPSDDVLQNSDDGEALFLTPLINEGKLEEGRNLSQVIGIGNVTSFSGYLTVNPKHNSNIFFWFFPASFNAETAPVLVWLQGGPGASSLFGLFVENGPFRVDENNNLHERHTAWTLTHSVIYFDNPVGTGFSFTDNTEGYVKTQDDVARDLYSALTQFFTLFPMYSSRDFYATGESYAGKYVPAIAHKIHTENKKSPQIFINLKGVAIGDGFSDPVNMINFGPYLKNVGLIDSREQGRFYLDELKMRIAIKMANWIQAFEILNELIFRSTGSYFANVTGFTSHYNYLVPHDPPDHSYYSKFVQQSHVRRGIHVGNRSFVDDETVQHYLRADICQSVIGWIVELLEAPEAYRVLIYSGQLDVIVAHVNTERMLDRMNWNGAQEYARADKKFWKVGEELRGYVKSVRNLTYMLVRNAGHMIPYDQPKWAYDMINRFTKGKPFV